MSPPSASSRGKKAIGENIGVALPRGIILSSSSMLTVDRAGEDEIDDAGNAWEAEKRDRGSGSYEGGSHVEVTRRHFSMARRNLPREEWEDVGERRSSAMR